jgi:regulator of sirC expression with transglutaminase-like and TPR domain
MDPKPVKARFQALLHEHGDSPPLDELCYLICQLGGHPVDIPEAQRQLAAAANSLPPTFEGVIAGLFTGPTALRGNVDDYYNVRNSMLSEVQRTRLGIPITLSVLAIEHARRIGVGVHGIGLPGHFIVGSADDPALFADPFHGGALLDSDGAEALYRRVTGRRQWSDEFLAPVSTRDIVFRILNNIRVACHRGLPDRSRLPWVLELLSWFPQGNEFDQHTAARTVAPFN